MLKSAIKRLLAAAHIEVRRTDHDWTDTSQFIPIQTTLDGARAAGLSVGDYIDAHMNHIPGATQATIDGMAKLGVFDRKLEVILEIGPGSGRYLEKVQQRCTPRRYEIYETALPWAQFLVDTHHVTSHPTDGSSLSSTPNGSVDLIHAHKVFNGISLTLTFGYWREMVRVMKSGGWAVFDLLDETCLDPDRIDAWGSSGLKTGAYPTAVPRAACEAYFRQHGFSLRGSFPIPLGPGITDVLIFQRA